MSSVVSRNARTCAICDLPGHTGRRCNSMDALGAWNLWHFTKPFFIRRGDTLTQRTIRFLEWLAEERQYFPVVRYIATRFCHASDEPSVHRLYHHMVTVSTWVMQCSHHHYSAEELRQPVRLGQDPITQEERQRLREIVLYLQRHRQRQVSRNHGLLSDIARKVTYVRPDRRLFSPTADCPVCLESKRLAQMARLTECQHWFCCDCLTRALRSPTCHAGCAYCRATIHGVQVFRVGAAADMKRALLQSKEEEH